MLNGSPSLMAWHPPASPWGSSSTWGLGGVSPEWLVFTPEPGAGRQQCPPGSGDMPQTGVALPRPLQETGGRAKVRPAAPRPVPLHRPQGSWFPVRRARRLMSIRGMKNKGPRGPR